MTEQHSLTEDYETPFKFNGKELDSETGYYYYGARYYDPRVSIWLSVDPLVEQTGDAYGYCYQNPVNLVDPNGKSAYPPVVGLEFTDGYVHSDADGTWIYEQSTSRWIGQSGAETYGNYIPLPEIHITNGDPYAGTYWERAKWAGKGPNPFSPSTDSRVALALVALPIAIIAIEAVGVGVVVDYLIEEAIETVIEEATGIPIITDPGDVITNGAKKSAKEVDFIVTPDGTAVPKDQKLMRKGFDDAGFPSKSATQTAEEGVIHTVPTKNGPVDVRTMDGSKSNPKRAVITHPNTNSPKTPSGRTTRDKNDNHINQH